MITWAPAGSAPAGGGAPGEHPGQHVPGVGRARGEHVGHPGAQRGQQHLGVGDGDQHHGHARRGADQVAGQGQGVRQRGVRAEHHQVRQPARGEGGQQPGGTGEGVWGHGAQLGVGPALQAHGDLVGDVGGAQHHGVEAHGLFLSGS